MRNSLGHLRRLHFDVFKTIHFTSRPFSSSCYHCYPRRDNNKDRGISAYRGTGLRRRQVLSVRKEEIPKPVLSYKRDSGITTDNNHPLWQFFNSKKSLLATPDENSEHGIIKAILIAQIEY